MKVSVMEKVVGLTDVGQIRQINEDSVLVDETIGLYAIADGMGGHGSGDVASKLALETLRSCITAESVAKALSSNNISDDQALALVFQAVAGVNQRVFKENVKRGHSNGTGMGTTLVGLCKFGNENRAITFNIGDSRLYEFQDAKLVQLTRDHTIYREWEEAGQIGPAPPRNIILRAIGLFADVEIDLAVISLRSNGGYLLCSDGLSGMVSDEEIAKLASETPDAQILGDKLIQRANDCGGIDNISVVAIIRSKTD